MVIELIKNRSLAGVHGNKTITDTKTLIYELENSKFICTTIIWYNLLTEINQVIKARKLENTIGLEARFEEGIIKKRTKTWRIGGRLVLKCKVEVYKSMLDNAIQPIKDRADQLSQYDFYIQ